MILVPVSNEYLYWHRVGEMEENAERQDDSDRMLLISILKLTELHVLLYFSTQKLWVNILWYGKNIVCLLD